jgi:gas vesicle protein
MTDHTTGNPGKTLMAVTIAGLAGAAAALLFAPRSGRETREKIKSEADKAKHAAEDKMHVAKGGLDSKLNQAKKMKDRISEAVTNTSETAKTEMENTKEEMIKQTKNDNREEE